jgi:hypothetical protein
LEMFTKIGSDRFVFVKKTEIFVTNTVQDYTNAGPDNN